MTNLLFTFLLLAPQPVDTLHIQSVVYEVSPVNTYEGTLVLTNQAVHFQTKNAKHQARNFTLPCPKSFHRFLLALTIFTLLFAVP